MIPDIPWSDAQGADTAALLLRHGAVLLRGASADTPRALADTRRTLGLEPAACTDRFAPRTDHGDGVYSWPEWAADRDMCLHHEQSQGLRFPGTLLLANLATADTGGTVILGDTRTVLATLPAELADRFRTQGWILTRNFHPYLGLPWQKAFGTDRPEELEARCAAERMTLTWAAKGALSTGQHRAAIVSHPGTGEDCWFNDVAFFNQWSVPQEERSVLLTAFGPDGLPLNTAFGDGEPLTEDDYTAITDAYEKATTRVAWQTGDVLVIDNVLTAHGREPYTGAWDVAVALASPTSIRDARWSPAA